MTGMYQHGALGPPLDMLATARKRICAAVSALSATAVVCVAAVAPAEAAGPFTVIDPTDAPDQNLDGTCNSTYQGLCTLRAAIQEAEFAGGGTILLSPGIGAFDLTIPAGAEAQGGRPSNATGDLDISTNVTVTGQGPDESIIDGLGAVRIFDVHRGGVLNLRGVTLQNGRGDFDVASTHRHGGAIHNHGTINLDRVAVIGSTAPQAWGGGGITNASTGKATLRNVTLARNSADHGGAIENLGQLRMTNVTVAENAAVPDMNPGDFSGEGGGIFTGADGDTRMVNTIVAQNTTGGDCASHGFVLSGYDLQGDGSCGFTQSTDILDDPGFDPFGFGPPIFYPLAKWSPAVDAGNTNPGACPLTDIRGEPRPQLGHGRCDIGSYER
jgi:hypothetical protein